MNLLVTLALLVALVEGGTRCRTLATRYQQANTPIPAPLQNLVPPPIRQPVDDA